MRLHPIVFFPAMVMVTAACFCQYDPFAHLFTKQEPEPADLVGTYVLTSQTMSGTGLTAPLDAEITVALDSRHVFTATNFPIWILSDSGQYEVQGLTIITGTWKVEPVGRVDGNDVWGVLFRPPLDSDAIPHLKNQEWPYGLVFSYGDPDSGDAMIFEMNDLEPQP